MGERDRFEAWYLLKTDTSHRADMWHAWQEAARQERETVAKLAEAYPCLIVDGAEVQSACRMIAAAIRSRSSP